MPPENDSRLKKYNFQIIQIPHISVSQGNTFFYSLLVVKEDFK